MIDDFTGFEKKSGELRKDHYGYMVDDKGYEPRHPQETLKVRGETNRVKEVRIETEIFLTTNEVKPEDL